MIHNGHCASCQSNTIANGQCQNLECGTLEKTPPPWPWDKCDCGQFIWSPEWNFDWWTIGWLAASIILIGLSFLNKPICISLLFIALTGSILSILRPPKPILLIMIQMMLSVLLIIGGFFLLSFKVVIIGLSTLTSWMAWRTLFQIRRQLYFKNISQRKVRDEYEAQINAGQAKEKSEADITKKRKDFNDAIKATEKRIGREKSLTALAYMLNAIVVFSILVCWGPGNFFPQENFFYHVSNGWNKSKEFVVESEIYKDIEQTLNSKRRQAQRAYTILSDDLSDSQIDTLFEAGNYKFSWILKVKKKFNCNGDALFLKIKAVLDEGAKQDYYFNFLRKAKLSDYQIKNIFNLLDYKDENYDKILKVRNKNFSLFGDDLYQKFTTAFSPMKKPAPKKYFQKMREHFWLFFLIIWILSIPAGFIQFIQLIIVSIAHGLYLFSDEAWDQITHAYNKRVEAKSGTTKKTDSKGSAIAEKLEGAGKIAGIGVGLEIMEYLVLSVFPQLKK